MGKRLAAVGMAAAIGVGGLTVAAVNPLQVAGAQDAPTTQTTGSTAPKHDGPLQRALKKLVADGTLTQAQADKVVEATKAEAKAASEARKDKRGETVAVVAKALGSTPDDVKAGLKAGTSIAEQAKAAGVDRQVVDDALTQHLTARIDAAVKDGKLTAEQATKAKARLDKAVDRIIDADPSQFGHGRLRDRIRNRNGN